MGSVVARVGLIRREYGSGRRGVLFDVALKLFEDLRRQHRDRAFARQFDGAERP